jgi:hypothetical protein
VETRAFKVLKTSDWQPLIISIGENEEKRQNSGILLHLEGRVSLAQKKEFISTAQKSIIEVGIRLNTYTNYFISQKEQAYRADIIELLKKGVTIKNYFLNPESAEAMLYFKDRALVQASEKVAIEEIKRIKDRLQEISNEFGAMKMRGSFSVFSYKHIPYNHFLVVDGDQPTAKMMVSHYLYAIRRADCVVMQFSKADEPVLYRKYWDSLQAFIADAKPI